MAALTPEDLSVHADFLRRLAVRLLRSPDLADDAVQETLALAWQKRPDVSSPRGWLSRTLRNVVRNTRRGERRRQVHEDRARRSPEDRSPEAILEREATRRNLIDAILRLPDAERDVVLLRYDEGLPPRKVAEALDVPVHTVHNRLRSGLARMRARLASTYGGDDKRWRGALGALVPMLPIREGGLTLGGLLVGKKMVVVAVALVIGLAVWWMFDDARSEDEAQRTPADDGKALVSDGEAGAAPGLVTAETTPPEANDDVIDRTPRVFGRVVDPVTGEPVTGARVIAFDFQQLRSITAETDADGRFDLTNSRDRTGAFHLVVEHPEHARNVVRAARPSAEPITLIRLEGGFIEGRLIDAGGAPMRRYRVLAVGRLFPPGETVDQSVASAGAVLPEELTVDRVADVDDADGAFRIGPLEPGAHVLLFQADGHPPLFEANGAAYYDQRGIDVAPGKTTNIGDVELPEVGELELGVVDAETEQLLEDVRIVGQTEVNGRSYPWPVEVDARGRQGVYVVPVAIAKGRLLSTDLRISKPGYGSQGLSLSGHANGTRIDVRMARSAQLTVTVLRPDGRPAAGSTLIIRRDSDRILIDRATLDAGGRASATNVPAGEPIELVVLNARTLSIVSVLPVTLAPGETREITLGGPDQTAVAGVLRVNGEPIGGAWVSLDTPRRRRVQIATDENGAFRFDGLEPGAHGIGISSDHPQVFLQRAFECEEGKVRRFDIDLAYPLRGTTEWKKTDEGASSLGNPSLLARPVEGAGFRVSTRLKDDGSFELPLPQARVYEIVSAFSDYRVHDAPRINPAEVEGPIEIRIVSDPRDGQAVFRIVDALTSKPVPDASYAYRSREMSGGGLAQGSVVDDRDLAIGTHEYVLRAPGYVAKALTVEITPDARKAEQTVKLHPSNGVEVVGFAPTSRAKEAGVRVGDVLLVYRGARVRNVVDLVTAIQDTDPIDAVAIELWRAGARLKLDVPGGRMGIQGVNRFVEE